MAFDENGIYHRVHSWTQDRLSEINKKIQAERKDEEDNGFANGLSQTFLRDGRAPLENDLNVNGNKIFNMAVGALETDAINQQQLKEAMKKADDALKKIANSFVVVETLPAKPDDSIFYFTKDKRLYKGSRRIIEIYYSNINSVIAEVMTVYRGEELVYKAEPYEPGTVLAFEDGEKSYSATLPRGVFKICVAAAGGTGTYWVAGGMGYASSGGGGAVVELTFYNPISQKIEIYAPPGLGGHNSQTGGDAYFKLGGKKVIISHGGKGASSGGTYEIDRENLQIISVQVEKNGNNGRSGFSGQVRVASVSPYRDWGWANEASSGPGGYRLEYIQYKPEEEEKG